MTTQKAYLPYFACDILYAPQTFTFSTFEKVQSTSYQSFIFCAAIIILSGLIYYPKWNKPATEATISWDVSGYYMYLPALLIYDDIKECSFSEKILEQYSPTYDFQQAFRHGSGNYVMKYPSGMAIMYLPAFLAGHIYALLSLDYPADGFSIPYQFSLFIWGLLIAIIGLFYLRKVLLIYFNDSVTALTILLIAIGSNYLNYSAIDGAMTHNYLFTLYTLLIYYTIHWHCNFHWTSALIIGLLVGIMALIRPTEIIACLIPLLWNINLWSLRDIQNKIRKLFSQYKKVITAVIITAIIGSIQLIYWKNVSGDWLVYSYQDQGFSWLHPHIHDGLLSYKSGWLIYSPIMVFGVIGIFFLFKYHRQLSGGVIPFLVLFTYIVTAWDIWWYGGSLGNRAMIQSYPLWAFPMAACIQRMSNWKIYMKSAIYCLMIVFIYFNLWFTHQAHRGGLLHAGMMTKAYFWKVLGTYSVNPLDTKLLDTDEAFYGEAVNPMILLTESFDESETNCNIDNSPALCLNDSIQYTIPIRIVVDDLQASWIRITADYITHEKEWEVWKMCQLQATLYNKDEIVKSKMIRIQRHLNPGIQNRVWMDVEIENQVATHMIIQWWNAGSRTSIKVDNLEVVAF